jgi:hypothetical protein
MERSVKAPVRNDRRVLDWSDERSVGDGIFVTTRYGLAWEAAPDAGSAQHVKSFANVKEVRSALKWVQHCQCLRCTSQGKLA